MYNLNFIIDAIIILIIFISFLIGAYRGFVKSIFKTFSSIISLVLAFTLQPIVAQLIKATPIFDAIKNYVADKLGLSLVPVSMSQPEQSKLIASLPLPDFLNEMLIENNNTVVYELLNASDINNYICGYIANIIINVGVILILVLFTGLIVKFITGALDIVAKLPVIHQLNYIGGGLIGIISGVIIIWLIFMVAMLFITADTYSVLQEAIDNSYIGKILFETNIFRNLIMGDLFNNG